MSQGFQTMTATVVKMSLFKLKKPNSHSFKLVRHYYKSLYKANLGPVYMEV